MTTDDIVTLVREAFENLEHLTSEEFAMGGDRPARLALVKILNHFEAIDRETAYDYGLIYSQDLAKARAEGP